MSTSKRLSGVVFTAGLAIVLIFGNSFPNALSLSSLENDVKSYYSSAVKLIDNTFSDRSNKVVMINFDDGLKSQLIYETGPRRQSVSCRLERMESRILLWRGRMGRLQLWERRMGKPTGEA